MQLSPFVYSNDNYFSISINALLTPDLISKRYDILDLENTSYQKIKPLLRPGKKTVAFISQDLDYYSLRHLEDILFIDKRSNPGAVLSYLVAGDKSFAYQVKNRLSKRENEVLSYIQRGLSAWEIGKSLDINIKTFYAHQRNLINKLNIENRIFLYLNMVHR